MPKTSRDGRPSFGPDKSQEYQQRDQEAAAAGRASAAVKRQHDLREDYLLHRMGLIRKMSPRCWTATGPGSCRLARPPGRCSAARIWVFPPHADARD